MKRLILGLLLAASAIAGEKVDACFAVHRQTRADATHYWAEWSNNCAFEISAVYVMVDFVADGKRIGSGVWPLYYPKGQHQYNRWTSPVELPDGVAIQVHGITIDATIALKYGN